jgi:hypothetical protein
MKFQINSSQSSFATDDFISFEDDENENENARYAEYARHARHAPHADFNIEDEFLPGDFFDIYDK